MSTPFKVAAAAAVLYLAIASGHSVSRGEESARAYDDDTAITAALKSRYVGNKDVDASSLGVETFDGTVVLSGFTENASERTTAEHIAWKVKGVRDVKNEIAVRR